MIIDALVKQNQELDNLRDELESRINNLEEKNSSITRRLNNQEKLFDTTTVTLLASVGIYLIVGFLFRPR